jgi:putative ABC transport system permease protein
MRELRAWSLRLVAMFRKGPRELELSEELESHLQMHILENVRAGMNEVEARRQALIKLGGMEATKEIYRERRGIPVVDTMLQDLRFAARMLRKNPGFTAVAVLVMALGIGANTAMFSVVNAVLLKPLAYDDPDRIVTLSTLWKKSGGHGSVSAPDFQDWHDQSTAFDGMAYYAGYPTAVTAGQSAEFVHIAEVSSEFFRIFRVEPVVGRTFSEEERKSSSPGAAIISYGYGVNHFGTALGALGQRVRVLGKTRDIVGVMPPGFNFPAKTSIWFPADPLSPYAQSRSAHNYRVVARLKPEVNLEQAQAQMTAIGTRLTEKYPDSNTGKNVAVTRMRDEMVSNFRLMLWVMLAAVGVLLLIACANLANMLLAKAVARTREIAIRAALGAGRGRIVRQLITESLVMTLLAGALGVLLALWGSRALVALAPGDVPRLSEAAIDARVLGFAFGVAVLASLLFGLAPALQVLRADLNKSLKQSTTRTSGGSVADRVRAALVVVEIALSVMLLAGAGLLLKSFIALQNVALGFRPERVLVMETSVPASDLKSARRATRFYRDLLSQLAALPGVSNAGATGAVPGHTLSDGSYWVDYLPKYLGVNAPQAVFSVVAPGTFATLGIPLLRGRDFSDSDTYDTPFSAVINEKLAKEAFPGQEAIGQVIYCGLDTLNPMKIVGIVGDVRQTGPAHEPAPEIYMAYQQHPQYSTDLKVLVRTPLGPGALVETMREKSRALSVDVPVKFTTMEASLSENVAAPRFRTLLLGIFAALAVCLAMAGVYGVMSYVVGQRSNEIGLRVALGASPRDVLRLVLRQALLLATAGIVVGLACAAAMTRLLTSMLFGIKPTDPLTYAAVVVILASVAMLASYAPARRAMRVDPLVALRYE